MAAVEGVLPVELEQRPAVSVASLERYGELISELLADQRRPPPDDWIRGHDTAAAEWDALLESLPAWGVRPQTAVSRLRRLRRRGR